MKPTRITWGEIAPDVLTPTPLTAGFWAPILAAAEERPGEWLAVERSQLGLGDLSQAYNPAGFLFARATADDGRRRRFYVCVKYVPGLLEVL